MTAVCGRCGTELAPVLLACPSCRSLVHGERLKGLASRAETEAAQGNASAAAVAWEQALVLLPPASGQHTAIRNRLAALQESAPSPLSAEAPAGPDRWGVEGRWLARGLGALAAVTVLLLSKGKFLLAGLTKLPTILSMVASAGVYWALWGWKFAVGLVLTTYVHEMGHVAALVRAGVAASPPMFVPGFGAFVRLRQALHSPRVGAMVGLAGPLWGLGAGAACLMVGWSTESASWLAVAQFTGVLNLFNLLPLWQLDGARAFEALGRGQRLAALGALGLFWWHSGQGLLVILMLGAGWQAVKPLNPRRNGGVLVYYLALVGLLTALAGIHVPVPSSH